jgi:hypothetical protein
MRPRLRLLFMVLALSVGVCAGMAQDAKHETQLRTVRGVVVDKSSESPVPSAVVFLKNIIASAASIPMSITRSMRKRMAQSPPFEPCRVSITKKKSCSP